jgi:hypothetical protein
MLKKVLCLAGFVLAISTQFSCAYIANGAGAGLSLSSSRSRIGYSLISARPRLALARGLKLKMGAEPTAVKEECTGPAREGEIGNVDVSSLKSTKPEDDVPTDGIINLSENAKKQLHKLRGSRGESELVLRVGVRSGGCRLSQF